MAVTGGSDAPAEQNRPLRDAAVLVPLYRDERDELRVVLVVRTEGGVHGGQIALPGGQWDPGDASLSATAIREAEEEIGLPEDAITILAERPVFETRTTGYRIAPFVARIVRPAAWKPDPREVADILEPRVSELLDPAAHGESMETFASWPNPVRIEFYRIGPHRLWGATYRILSPLLPELAAGAWPV